MVALPDQLKELSDGMVSVLSSPQDPFSVAIAKEWAAEVVAPEARQRSSRAA
jgi:hypothetical protein